MLKKLIAERSIFMLECWKLEESRDLMETSSRIKLCFGLLFLAILVTLTGCGNVDLTKGEIAKYDYALKSESSTKLAYEETEEITNYVKITTNKDKVILLELYPDVAPITVKNFQKLVQEKFYDGLTFHRIIENMMIQGGDPLGTGYGGSNEKIKGEFSSNGVKNDLKHEPGVISMARSNDPDSASSQFFICVGSVSMWDGEYATFGKVIAGYDVVESISKVKTDSNDKPTQTQKMQTVRFVNIEEV